MTDRKIDDSRKISISLTFLREIEELINHFRGLIILHNIQAIRNMEKGISAGISFLIQMYMNFFKLKDGTGGYSTFVGKEEWVKDYMKDLQEVYDKYD